MASPEINAAWESLSDGDRSVLVAALDQPGALMMTSRDSPNFRFWSLLEAQGLMRGEPMPEGLSDIGVTFAIEQENAEKLRALLDDLSS